ncbi:MAG: hypothetical protein ACP5G2_00580 [Candidatus Bipolaricaulaceae bacterium]
MAVWCVLALGLLVTGAVKNPGTLVHLWTSDVRTMDPAYVTSTPGSYAPFNVYDRLLNFKGEEIDKFVPALASVVPSVANGLIHQDEDGRVYYTFPIREGVYCHYVGVRDDQGTVQWKPFDSLTPQEKGNMVPGYGEITPQDVKY